MTALKNNRIGVVAIINQDPNDAYKSINEILHQYSSIIKGRLGLPDKDRKLGIITLIVDGDTDQIGAMTGKIGQITNVTVKSVFAKT